ncbi:hypothetical protein EDB84DRAFT_1564781 [Lactarius hengduanensis]|nr:hypothetical protein EDB84DRAFT_1564781 [Lactarius hengduanensis]
MRATRYMGPTTTYHAQPQPQPMITILLPRGAIGCSDGDADDDGSHKPLTTAPLVISVRVQQPTQTTTVSTSYRLRSKSDVYSVWPEAALNCSLVTSALRLFVDVWFILVYSNADVHNFQILTVDLYGSYFFFAVSSRLPLIALFVAVLALVVSLGPIAWTVWPAAVLVMCVLVSVLVSLQFIVYGSHRLALGLAWMTLRGYLIQLRKHHVHYSRICTKFLQNFYILWVDPAFKDARSERGELHWVWNHDSNEVRLETAPVDENLHGDGDARIRMIATPDTPDPRLAVATKGIDGVCGDNDDDNVSDSDPGNDNGCSGNVSDSDGRRRRQEWQQRGSGRIGSSGGRV